MTVSGYWEAEAASESQVLIAALKAQRHRIMEKQKPGIIGITKNGESGRSRCLRRGRRRMGCR